MERLVFVSILTLGVVHTLGYFFTSRIVDGDVVDQGEYPFVAVIHETHGKPICHGTLIQSRVVVTLARCLLDVQLGEVWLGGTQLYNRTDFLEIHRINAGANHSFFRVELLGVNDIAVILLDTESKITPVTLNANTSLEEEGIVATVSGWGETRGGLTLNTSDRSEYLQEARVPMVSFADCLSFWDGDAVKILPGTICAGNLKTGGGSCYKDSGAPLFVQADRETILLGVSYANAAGCNLPCAPQLYVQVSAYLCFLKVAMRDRLGVPVDTSGCENFTETETPPSSNVGVVSSGKECDPSNPPIQVSVDIETVRPSPPASIDPLVAKPSTGISTGAILGIVIGIVLSISLAILVSAILIVRRKRLSVVETSPQPPSTPPIDENASEWAYIRSGTVAMQHDTAEAATDQLPDVGRIHMAW